MREIKVKFYCACNLDCSKCSKKCKRECALFSPDVPSGGKVLCPFLIIKAEVI
ncbi:MAG: hypothetical protein J7L07_02795 [Candidatus Odinarchaeota archaeon]|nr:hypothetical protein [Candidatus Odinarchaeota archaeon]